MTHGRNLGQDREAMLRRVAIVLSSLPATVASELLGSVAADSKQAVRRAIKSLEDVDPLERRRAFRAFRVSVEQQRADTVHDSESGKTLSSRSPRSASRVVSADAVGDNSTASTPSAVSHPRESNDRSSSMSFLEDVEDSVLLRLLDGEHPQTVALVFASVSPEKAGRVLPLLDAKRQAETLGRIGRLETFPDAAIEEVSAHFKNRIREIGADEAKLPGRTALNAILAAMPNQTYSVGNPPTQNPSMGAVAPAQATFLSGDEPEQDLVHRLSVAKHTLPQNASTDLEILQPPGLTGSEMSPPSQSENDDARSLVSTDSIARHLERLSPKNLCQALGLVDTRVAMLTLCGLPNQTAQSALALLPKAKAKQVRTAMNSLGSMNLRDIDHAKEAVAQASYQTMRRAPLAA